MQDEADTSENSAVFPPTGFLVLTVSFIYFIFSCFSICEEKISECRRKIHCSQMNPVGFVFLFPFGGELCLIGEELPAELLLCRQMAGFCAKSSCCLSCSPSSVLFLLPSLLIFCVLVSLSEHSATSVCTMWSVSVVHVCVWLFLYKQDGTVFACKINLLLQDDVQ